LFLRVVTALLKPYPDDHEAGLYSYSIYWGHVAVKVQGLSLMRKYIPWELSYGGGLAVIAVASVLVGVLMAKLIELPVLRLRDRLFPSRSSMIAASHPEPIQSRGDLQKKEECQVPELVGAATTATPGLW
jgi:hypothetical protein